MTSGDESNESDLVRRGYDALSYHYRSDDAEEGRYAPWLAGLRTRLGGQQAGCAPEGGC